MKKILFVLSGIILLSLASCNKEEINPNQDLDFEIRNFSNGCSNDEKTGNGGCEESSNDPTDPSITDPNRDEDEEIKVKRKRN